MTDHTGPATPPTPEPTDGTPLTVDQWVTQALTTAPDPTPGQRARLSAMLATAAEDVAEAS